jgi:deoxyribose-phosphate aldolase
MNLNTAIEHTLLKPDTTTQQVKEICQEAIQYGFGAVCIPPFFVKTATQQLEDTSIKVVTVVGFPMGYSAIPTKVEATKRAVDEGADEVDMVVNIAAIKDGNWSHVRNDIDSVTTAVHLKGKAIKVILETGLLSVAEIKQLCDICQAIGVNYIKTSTGINAGGATIEMVKLLKENVTGIKIKASGGIRTKAFAMQLLEAGADRIGTSAGIKIVQEA